MTPGCLSDDIVFRFVQGKLSDRELASVDEHLVGCVACCRVVAESSLAVGVKVGRYEIEGVIGAGAIGVVYRAFDPQLQRHVALKLMVPPTGSGTGAGDEQSKLMHEARALARLAHPNVVAVHDAGPFEDQVFVVMEMVQGKTLAGWLKERTRPWPAILDVFLEAARGLAAAHAAGLVHRDFKPDNVLVGDDGRVRVTDFGLAQPSGRPQSPATAGAGSSTTAGSPTTAGTPAFMAPEQFLRGEAEPRTDQFSFCVALYVALYGQWPFGRNRAPGVEPSPVQTADVVAGHIQAPPAGELPPTGEVPLALFEILRTGLAADPAARYPSMDALAIDLRCVRAGALRRRKRAALVGVPLVVLVIAGAVVLALKAPAGVCGNAVIDPGEECDNGKNSDGGACLTTCRVATCGDGHVRAGIEECDEGSQNGSAACTNRCLACGGVSSLGWTGNGNCYTRHDDPRSWAEARDVCARSGGDLVTYRESYESNAVSQSLLVGRASATWTGLQAREGSRSFEWATAEPTSSRFSRWAPGGQPTVPENGGRRCVTETPAPARTGVTTIWIGADCEQRHAFVCERTGWLSRPHSTHAYKIFTHPLAWPEARVACERAGAHLATLTDIEEHAFVAAMAPGAAWLGGRDMARKRTFAWITGEPWAFHRFAPDEPDDADRRSDCLVLSAYEGWRDRDCALGHAFVCEAE